MEITPEAATAALEGLRWPKIDVRLSAADREWLEENCPYAL
jgi:hypothetical protein